MKKIILIALILTAAISPLIFLRAKPAPKKQELVCSLDLKACQDNLLKYLKLRQDNLAQGEIDKILSIQRDDLCALWAKAEILRRSYKFKESEELLNQVLAKCPGHASSLITLAYIKYHENSFSEASKLLKEALHQPDLERENRALIYMLMGSINSKKASRGGILGKVAYGTRIKGYFEKARGFAPDLPEVHLGLGTYYLLAPRIAGGDVDMAIEELEWAVRLAPDFATANARLAQAYKQKGNLEKYNFYIQRAKDLDAGNEAVKEIERQI